MSNEDIQKAKEKTAQCCIVNISIFYIFYNLHKNYNINTCLGTALFCFVFLFSTSKFSLPVPNYFPLTSWISHLILHLVVQIASTVID